MNYNQLWDLLVHVYDISINFQLSVVTNRSTGALHNGNKVNSKNLYHKTFFTHFVLLSENITQFFTSLIDSLNEVLLI